MLDMSKEKTNQTFYLRNDILTQRYFTLRKYIILNKTIQTAVIFLFADISYALSNILLLIKKHL